MLRIYLLNTPLYYNVMLLCYFFISSVSLLHIFIEMVQGLVECIFFHCLAIASCCWCGYERKWHLIMASSSWRCSRWMMETTCTGERGASSPSPPAPFKDAQYCAISWCSSSLQASTTKYNNKHLIHR